MPRHTCQWLLPIMFLAFTPGCALLGSGAGHEGGTATLTEAAAEADSSRKHRRLDVGYTTPPETSVEVEAGASQYQSGSGQTSATTKSDPADFLVGAVVGFGALGGDKYDGFAQFGLDLGFYVSRRARFDVAGSFSPIQFAGESIAGQSFKNEFELDLDITARYYLTSPNTFVGVYPIAGVTIGTLFWDYNHPVSIVEDTGPRQVSTDYINHFSLYGGAGMSLAQFRHIHVGSNLTGGVRFYENQSSNGFGNTLFPSAGFVQMRFEFSIRNEPRDH